MKLNANYLALIAGLFVILSPGLLLTLPPLTKDNATTIGVSYGAAGAAASCTTGDYATETQCSDATRFFVSGYTSVLAIVIHTLVFAVLVNYLPEMVGLKSFSFNAVAVLSVLFLLLSPGLVLTLPALGKVECGINHKNIADGTDFCDAITTIDSTTPNCKKCTSFWNSGFTSLPATLVHAIVFGGVSWFALSYVK
jgi:hypothetical protein